MTSSGAYGALTRCCVVHGSFAHAMARLVLDNFAAHFAGREPPAPLV